MSISATRVETGIQLVTDLRRIRRNDRLQSLQQNRLKSQQRGLLQQIRQQGLLRNRRPDQQADQQRSHQSRISKSSSLTVRTRIVVMEIPTTTGLDRHQPEVPPDRQADRQEVVGEGDKIMLYIID